MQLHDFSPSYERSKGGDEKLDRRTSESTMVCEKEIERPACLQLGSQQNCWAGDLSDSISFVDQELKFQVSYLFSIQ